MHVLIILYLVAVLARGRQGELYARGIATVVLVVASIVLDAVLGSTEFLWPTGIVCVIPLLLSFVKGIDGRLAGGQTIYKSVTLVHQLAVALRIHAAALVCAIMVVRIKAENGRINSVRIRLETALAPAALYQGPAGGLPLPGGGLRLLVHGGHVM